MLAANMQLAGMFLGLANSSILDRYELVSQHHGRGFIVQAKNGLTTPIVLTKNNTLP
jgi:hypothetical protein